MYDVCACDLRHNLLFNIQFLVSLPTMKLPLLMIIILAVSKVTRPLGVYQVPGAVLSLLNASSKNSHYYNYFRFTAEENKMKEI